MQLSIDQVTLYELTQIEGYSTSSETYRLSFDRADEASTMGTTNTSYP
jgi:hypothetical protein